MKNNTITLPCFPYPGGKTKMREYLLSLIPPHKTYVEPFAGGLSVLLGKPRTKCEVVNDINEDLVMFFRYVRLHGDALLAEIDSVLAARREFEFFRSREPDTELGKALAFFFRQMVSFGGIGESFSRRRDKAPHWGSDVIKQRILAVRERLRRVYIECKPANEIIRFYDTKETFFFVDPPYVCANPARYEAFSREQMAELRDALAACAGTWLLTCDNSEICREIFSGFKTTQVSNLYSLANAAPKAVSELVVFSKNFPVQNETRFPVSGRQVEAA